jgi:hypothetical protein
VQWRGSVAGSPGMLGGQVRDRRVPCRTICGDQHASANLAEVLAAVALAVALAACPVRGFMGWMP